MNGRLTPPISNPASTVTPAIATNIPHVGRLYSFLR